MKTHCFYFIVWLASLGQVLAQSASVTDQIKKLVPNPVPQSPNVAALGEYGNYTVNLYTGLPEISIPIFEATSGSLKVPITLSYHASGIRYTDQASWVGLGWSLSAGGQVSRNTVGKPDEQGYYTTPLGSSAICSNHFYIKNAATQVTDTEPDIFSYSMPGKNGKFLLGAHLGTPDAPYYLIPYEPIKLEPDYSATQFQKFKITDENGVVYNFGKTLSGTPVSETTGSDNGGVTTTSRTAWYLTDMTAPNANDQITFSYQDVGLAYIVDASDRLTVSDLCSGYLASCNVTTVSAVTESLSVSTVNQKGQDEIYFEGGKVKFILGSRRNDQHATANLKSLDRIEIYGLHNGTYYLVKYYKFTYSYFKNNANTIDLRLKLDELQVFDKNGQFINKYQFAYYTNNFSWDIPTNSKRRDYLGYFNNRAGNTSLIPVTTIPYQSTEGALQTTLTIGTANRSTDTTYLKEGVLRRITFPTAGYSEFSHEPHRYQESGLTQYPGGLRIKKISSYDGISNQPLVKSYKYGDGETGFGSKNFFLANSFFTSGQLVDSFGQEIPNNGGVGSWRYRSRTYLSSSALSLDSYDGAPVVYPVVAEYNGDFIGHQGKTVFEYDAKVYESDQAFVVPLVGKAVKDSRHWKRGKLTKATVYSSSGLIMSSATTSYQLFQNQNKAVGMAAGTYLIFPMVYNIFGNQYTTCVNESNETIVYSEFQLVNYPQSTGAYRESGRAEFVYENGDINKYVVKSSSSSFDPNFLQVIQSTQSGAGATESMITKIKYPFNYTFTGAESGSALGVKMLKDKNIITVPIEQYTIKQVGSTNSVIGGQVTSFKTNPCNLNYVSGDVVYLLETSAGIPEANYTTTNNSGSSITMDSRFKPGMNTFQDLNGNMLQVQQTNNQYVGYQWGYSNSLPVAEVSNAQNNKHINVSQSTTSSAITMAGPTPSVFLNKTFTVDYTSTIYLKLGVSGNSVYSTLLSYTSATTAIGSATNIVLSKNAVCGSAPIVATFTNVPAGTHTITLTLTTPDSGVSSLGACGQVDYPVATYTPTGICEFFYEGFEDESASGTATPHTGKKYLTSSYTVPFTKPNSRAYIVEYWYLSGTSWIYATAPYVNNMTLSGTAIDDVRVYPSDARMKTYTYEPGIGISSVLDENGRILYYNYDNLGRLSFIKNEQGGIEKQYSYNYKN